MRPAATLSLAFATSVVILACGGRTQAAPPSGCEANEVDGGTNVTIAGATVTLRTVMGVLDENKELAGVLFSESADGCRVWLDSQSAQQNHAYFVLAVTELSRASVTPADLPIDSSGSTVAVVASGCAGSVAPQGAIGGSLSPSPSFRLPRGSREPSTRFWRAVNA